MTAETLASQIQLPSSPPATPALTTDPIHPAPSYPSYRAFVSPLLLAATVSVMSVTSVDPIAEVKRSGASTVLRKQTVEVGQKVSFSVARQLALQTLEDAERALQEERSREALLFEQFEEEDA